MRYYFVMVTGVPFGPDIVYVGNLVEACGFMDEARFSLASRIFPSAAYFLGQIDSLFRLSLESPLPLFSTGQIIAGYDGDSFTAYQVPIPCSDWL